MPFDEAGIDTAAQEIGIGGGTRQEGGICFHRPDFDRAAGLRQLGRRFAARGGVDDHFRDHRIIVGRDHIALLHRAIHPDVGRQLQMREPVP